MRIFLIAILISAVLLGGALLMLQGSSVPASNFTDYAGNGVVLEDFLGKNIIVNSWAAWCPFCVQELKDFAVLQEEFGDQIKIIAIDRAESLDTAKSYTDSAGVTGRLILLLDPADSFYKSIGGFSMPETIFMNGEGETVFHKRGPMPLEEMREKARKIFKI